MSIIGEIKDKVTRYVDVYIKLFKVDFILRTSNVMGFIIFAIIGLLLLLCAAIFMGFGLVELFMAVDISKLGAFFIVVGIYLLLLVLLISCRRPVTRFFASGIIRELTRGDDDEDDE